jgi:hypothetical protein
VVFVRNARKKFLLNVLRPDQSQLNALTAKLKKKLMRMLLEYEYATFVLSISTAPLQAAETVGVLLMHGKGGTCYHNYQLANSLILLNEKGS